MKREEGIAGLAATYSSAAGAAVPLARRVFMAEFGMGSGVWPLAMATRLVLAKAGAGKRVSCDGQGSVGARPPPEKGLVAARGRHRISIKRSIERLVPVSWNGLHR